MLLFQVREVQEEGVAGGMEDMGMGGPGDLDFTEDTDTGTGGHVSTRVHCTTYCV